MSDVTGGTSIIIRLEIQGELVTFAQIATTIEEAGGDIIAIDVSGSTETATIRDLTVNIMDQTQMKRMLDAIQKLNGVKVINVSDQTFSLHLGGKIETTPKVPIRNRDDLSRVYTPDVARICMAIHEKPSDAFSLTIKRNTVAVVSDGSAVLGLGNIGPEAAMPVMEGKAMLFKQLGGVNAFPICLDTQDTDEIVKIVKSLGPTFGGINLEDIKAPRCFEIEERLIEEMEIPVFHDDQHGTAVVLLAGLLNAVKLVGKKLSDCKVVVCGIGAAGTACTKMLLKAGVKNVIGVGREGAISAQNTYGREEWKWYAENTNPGQLRGSLDEVIEGADVFIGLTSGGVNILKVEHLKKMAKDPIVFAMANPTPEISPEEAGPYVRVIATGRSDYPNQINNVLCFPGLFRGVLDCRARRINDDMKLAAAKAIASVVSDHELNESYIIPSIFNKQVAEKIREAVIEAAFETGEARINRADLHSEEALESETLIEV